MKMSLIKNIYPAQKHFKVQNFVAEQASDLQQKRILFQ